jgi:hypothetical protein
MKNEAGQLARPVKHINICCLIMHLHNFCAYWGGWQSHMLLNAWANFDFVHFCARMTGENKSARAARGAVGTVRAMVGEVRAMRTHELDWGGDEENRGYH